MLNAVAVAPFSQATLGLGLPPPPQRHGYEPQWTEDAPVDQEEPEIVRLFMAHYRTLLRLRHLTPPQRLHLTRLLAMCEAQLPVCIGGPPDAPALANGDPPRASHHALECLTAIRLYAIGAQRELAIGRPDPAAQALAEIITQVDRAHALFAASRPPVE